MYSINVIIKNLNDLFLTQLRARLTSQGRARDSLPLSGRLSLACWLVRYERGCDVSIGPSGIMSEFMASRQAPASERQTNRKNRQQ